MPEALATFSFILSALESGKTLGKGTLQIMDIVNSHFIVNICFVCVDYILAKQCLSVFDNSLRKIIRKSWSLSKYAF